MGKARMFSSAIVYFLLLNRRVFFTCVLFSIVLSAVRSCPADRRQGVPLVLMPAPLAARHICPRFGPPRGGRHYKAANVRQHRFRSVFNVFFQPNGCCFCRDKLVSLIGIPNEILSCLPICAQPRLPLQDMILVISYGFAIVGNIVVSSLVDLLEASGPAFSSEVIAQMT